MTPAKKEPAPVVSLGPVAAPTVRTGSQLVAGSFLVEGLTVFGVPLTDAQGKWLGVALTLTIAFAMNIVEKAKGRKLVGVSK